MNRLAQFLQYTGKVFGLKGLLGRVRDGRVEPRVPILPLIVCLMLGVVLRIGSYNDLAQQTQSRRRWRRLCGLKDPVAHEIFGIPVGTLRLITVWPFPEEEIARMAKGAKQVIVLENNLGQIYPYIKAEAAHYAGVSFLAPKLVGQIQDPEDILRKIREVTK